MKSSLGSWSVVVCPECHVSDVYGMKVRWSDETVNFTQITWCLSYGWGKSEVGDRLGPWTTHVLKCVPLPPNDSGKITLYVIETGKGTKKKNGDEFWSVICQYIWKYVFNIMMLSSYSNMLIWGKFEIQLSLTYIVYLCMWFAWF